MEFEQKINYHLNNYPALKKVIKRIYQFSMYSISSRIKSEGNIIRISPNEKSEFFFGYYDKCPWDITGRYMLCMKAQNTWSDVSPKHKLQILLIDTHNNKVKVIAESSSWNVQQGCMAQWLGPDFKERIIYNDYRNGNYCSIILNVFTGKEEKIITSPIYAVSNDGKTALTLDFSRLYRLRPGYGYYNLPEKTANERIPDKTCIWKINIENSEVSPLLKYTDFAYFEQRKEMINAEHKVNHLMISPNGKRFMVLHRWFEGHRKYTRLVTCNVDGTDIYVLSDDDMVSHCYWKNDNEIIAFENKKDGGTGYYLMKDKTQEHKRLWPQISNDGHPSYCPTDSSLVVFDTYPNRARIQEIKIARDTETEVKTIAKIFAPFKYDNDTRCDCHPRWSRDGSMICFDAAFEGHKGLYVVKL